MIPLCDLRARYLSIKSDIDRAVMEVLASGRYVKGPKVTEFEEKWAKFCGYKYGIAVGSGALSLEIAIQSLGIKDKQIYYNYETFEAIPNAIERTHNIPVAVDISRYINEKGDLTILAHHHHWESLPFVPTIEDASHAHGYRPIGRVAIFSFFPAKILGAMGEGGIIVSDEKDVYERGLDLKSHGRGGTNARMDEIQAAILLAELPHLDEWVQKRQKIVDRYDRAFGIKTGGALHCYYCVPGSTEKIEALKKVGIETSEKYSPKEMAIPLYPEMTEEQIEKVIKEVGKVL